MEALSSTETLVSACDVTSLKIVLLITVKSYTLSRACLLPCK
jgi:hypothetical protein